MPTSEIKKIPSLSERRSEIIIPGALILKTSMDMLNFNQLTISERALREGLVVDWMLDFLLQYAFTEFLLVYNLDCHLLAQYTMGPQLHQT